MNIPVQNYMKTPLFADFVQTREFLILHTEFEDIGTCSVHLDISLAKSKEAVANIRYI